ncbi:hypothetical protein D9M69_604560 [compost metagenome]
MLQAVGVFAIAPVLGTARRLHVGRAPGFRADRAQERGGMRGAGTDFHVVGLQQGATLLVPVFLERKDDLLKGEHRILGIRPPGRACPGRGKPGILTGAERSCSQRAIGRLHLARGPPDVPLVDARPGRRQRRQTNGRMIPG